jgi:hypothetical protein
MKYINKIILTTLAVVGFTSCNNDETANTNYTSTVKPIISVEDQSTTNVIEGDIVEVTLRSDSSNKDRMDVKLELVSGGEYGDYTLVDSAGEALEGTSVDDGFGLPGYKVSIPKYEDNLTIRILIKNDNLQEGTENFRFKLSSTDNRIGVVGVNDEAFIDVTVNDLSSESFYAIVNWDTQVTYETTYQYVLETDADDEVINHTESLCGLADIDFYLGSTSPSPELPISATGECPEVTNEYNDSGAAYGPRTAVLADGDYPILLEAYSFDLDLDSGDPENEIFTGNIIIPVTVTVGKNGGFSTTYTIPNAWTSRTGLGLITAGRVEVSGGKYTVYDQNDELVAAE